MSKTDDELRERLRLKDAIRGVVRDSLPHPVTTDDWNRLVKGIEQLITARDAEREAAIRIESELQVWKEVRRSYPKKATLQGRAVSKLTLADIDRKITELEAIKRKEEE